VRAYDVDGASGSEHLHLSQVEEARFKDIHSCDVGILWNEVGQHKTSHLGVGLSLSTPRGSAEH